LPLAQFLLPGEFVLYEAPDSVYYRRTPFALYVTGERLLLYSEGGLFSAKGRLDVRFPGHTLTLTGSPETVKGVWRALQQRPPAQGRVTADDEVTLVSALPPLFDDEQHPPAQVEPLRAVASVPTSQKAPVLRRPAALGLLFCLVALVATSGMFYWRRGHTTKEVAPPRPAESPAAATPGPTPSPTPITLHVMDEVFTLEGGSHRALKFAVPAGAGGARVSGGFRVTSGSSVDFYLMRQEQYDRFALGESPDVASVVYREAQWNARVGERLSPGDYYLVFDNRDSGEGAQTVAAEFFLVYDGPGTTP
jgi:hypothetical protein